MRRAGRRADNRGFILISSYLMLFVLFLYSNALTVQTMSQRTVADRTREELQALNLAQGTLEQLGDEFFQFLSVNVYQLTYQGDAVKALAWLDSLGQSAADGTDPTPPHFLLEDCNKDSLFDSKIATFEEDAGSYNQADATGFIKLNALRLRIAAKKRGAPKF